MGCVISREASSGVNSESKGERRDLSVESTGKVDEVVVPKVDSKTAEVHVGGGEGKKEENVHGGEKPPRGERRRSKPNPRSGNVPKQSRGAQVAAGWPPWLTEACGEALNGWIPRKADTFEKIDKIGSGTYSNVYKAKDMLTGKIVALKKVRFDNLEPESVRFMAREILILRRLDHINVVKLEGLVTSRMSCSLYLVLEYMEHDLAGLAASPEIKFTEPQVKCYMHQLLSGLEHCHNCGVLHRDIKGSNLLIDNGGVLKIADFGLASFFDPNHKHPMTSRVVTLWYRPPELLLGATDYGVGVDLCQNPLLACSFGGYFHGVQPPFELGFSQFADLPKKKAMASLSISSPNFTTTFLGHKLKFLENSKKLRTCCSVVRAPRCAAAGTSYGGNAPKFPRINVWDPYKRLGVTYDASEEEIWGSRNFLLQQYGGHERSEESIEAAFEKILMTSFQQRKKTKINLKSKLKKKVEESPPWVKNLLSFVEVPPVEVIFRRLFLFAFMGGWSIMNSAEGGPAFQVAVSLAACIYFLNEKTKSLARASIFGLAALVTGWVCGSVLVPNIPSMLLHPTWTLELVTSLVVYLFLFLACTFLK